MLIVGRKSRNAEVKSSNGRLTDINLSRCRPFMQKTLYIVLLTMLRHLLPICTGRKTRAVRLLESVGWPSPSPECRHGSTRTGRARRDDRRQVRGLDGAEKHIAQQAGWLGRSGLFSWSWRRRGWDSKPTDRRNLSTVFKTVPIDHSGTPPEAQKKTDDREQMADGRWQMADGSAGSGRAAGARVVHWPTSSMMSSAT